jgi:hypothetical protein
MPTPTELRAHHEALTAQRSSGVARVSHDGKSIDYRCVAEIDRALEALDREIAAAEGRQLFYPEGVEGLFEIYYAPADTFETVNTVGLPLYARMIPDRDRDEWVWLEIESNPLPICTRPQVLRSARRT